MEALPFADPLQVGSELKLNKAETGVGAVIAYVLTEVQPRASVTVTE
jgi:hypothetical protein